MDVPELTLELIERFSRNRDAYLSGAYNETQLRREFIDPFFETLGWDMLNKAGYAEAYKDVIHEDAIKVGGYTKAPDYCFRIGGARKFFVEAKKPSVNIKDDISPAFQLRRYAWSAKLPLSILTDFEEFAVYDCRVKPVKTDKASTARILYLTFDKYPEKWDDITPVFSRDAILKGSFDKYVETTKGKKGTAEVDYIFLKEIETWRDSLARNTALRNPGLSQRDLNFAVQAVIDRIIFLRICEDRGIEEYGRLLALLNGTSVYARLFELFQRADERYNSGLFHFRDEKARHESPDLLTPSLALDDKPLKEIVKNLYYPDSAYEFSVLPADILGQVYEQFLGKVIRLTAGHRAVVEDKPEVKKAGGVYYTPTYIVDYIIDNTVGKLLEGKTPKQVSKLRILDPACGSGSFLIGAYQYLLDWHRDRYVDEGANKHTKVLYQGPGGEWRLTTAERKRILLNNIYGVDIDPQAVEVTKLSLLLKVLEGESEETLSKQLQLFHERALPDLSDNIKCGNSLIGPDFYENQQMTLLDDEERYRINAFDWNTEFAEVKEAGGFDAVIGNPPYIGFHGFKVDKDYLKSSFVSAKGKFDYYLPFVENGIELLKEKGILGFICPTNYTKRDHGQALRSYLRTNVTILEICDFQDVQIFTGALNYTGIFIFEKSKPKADSSFFYRKRSISDEGFNIGQADLGDDTWVFQDKRTREIIQRIEQQKVSLLGEMSLGISEGIVTGNNSVFLLERDEADKLGIEPSVLRPCLRGKQVNRYSLDEINELIVFPYKIVDGKTTVMDESELRQYKNLWSYLESRKDDLAGRPYFEKSRKAWYELWCQRDMQMLQTLKIAVPELSEANCFALADGKTFYGDTVCGITLRPDVDEDIKYILGILNSALIEFHYKRTTVPKAGGFFIYKTMFLKNIPIRRIGFAEPAENIRHERMVSLVEQMLSFHREFAESKTPNAKTVAQRQIDATDKEIDQLVYKLYSLTDDEIETIEKAVK